MDAYEGYPKIKGKILLIIAWSLHDLILLPAILYSVESFTFFRIDPPQFVRVLLTPSFSFLILGEMFFLTYIVSALLFYITLHYLIRRKNRGHLAFSDCLMFGVFTFLCIIGLLSSHEILNGTISV